MEMSIHVFVLADFEQKDLIIVKYIHKIAYYNQ